MVANSKERLLSLLCDDSKVELLNIKFLRGDSPDLKAEELCEEVHSAILQIRAGAAETSERFEKDSELPKVDTQELASVL